MLYKITFCGLVQGVGFRPFLYRQAKKFRLCGCVRNTGHGVDLIIDRKISPARLLSGQPPMSRVDKITVTKSANRRKYQTFTIQPSTRENGQSEIPPDIFLCADCQKEMRDPANRRYGYFFITCTNCGPRYTIVARTPYDRANTALGRFPMCPECQKEYRNLLNHRYHAETIACPKCGPKLALYHHGQRLKVKNPIKATAALIKKGKIVAIKGIGGFHLVCQARPKTVRNLRRLTGRPRKPFALLVKNITMARRFARLNKIESNLLASPSRPIIIALKKCAAQLRAVSSLDSLGLMLPYTGSHYLLFDYLNEPLVFTSANYPDQPLTTRRSEQFVADVLDHNRLILNPVDDSVIKVINDHPFFLRKARGFVPDPLCLPTAQATTALALGAEQNSAFAVRLSQKIITSPHLGQTHAPATLNRFQRTLKNFFNFYRIHPKEIIFDQHPEYATRKLGIKLAKQMRLPVVSVQHHLAHALAVGTEHNLTEYLSIVADGAGYGTDSKIWGGEIIHIKCRPNFWWQRVASLAEQPLLGGDLAVRHPTRMLLGILSSFLDERSLWQVMKRFFNHRDFTLLLTQLRRGLNITATTSTGRILDAAAALLGICTERTYDSEPALTLEAQGGFPDTHLKPVITDSAYADGRRYILQTAPLFQHLLEHRVQKTARLAATAQYYLACGFYQMAKKVNSHLPLTFSGGVAYNRIITTYLSQKGVLLNKKVPPGDGGISVGQLLT